MNDHPTDAPDLATDPLLDEALDTRAAARLCGTLATAVTTRSDPTEA